MHVKYFNNFNDAINKIGNGLDYSKVGQINVESVGGQTYDIVSEKIQDIKYDTIQDYEKIRDEKLAREEEEKHRVIYSNIQDERFNDYENSLFGKDLQEKAQYYKGMQNYGYNAVYNGFGRRDRHVRQLSNAYDAGLDKAKSTIKQKTLNGNQNVILDEKEEKEKAGYYLKSFSLNKPKQHEKKKIDFSKVIEWQTREQLGLMNGRQPDVSEIVKKRVDEYNKLTTNKSNDLISNNVGGFFTGGFNRRKMLNKVQINANNEQPQDLTETVGEIDENSYYNEYGHGSGKIQSAIIDIIKKNENMTKLNGVI